MATLLLNRGRVKLVKNNIGPIVFIKFVLFDKINIKYEIRVSELTPPPDFSVISTKNEKLVKSSSKVGL